MEALKFVVAPFLLGYFIGGIPFGFILVYAIKGVDVRKYGSGNIGATNVMRVAGFRWGVMAFLLDVAKGVTGVVDVTMDARTYNSMLYGCRCDRGARFPYISEVAWW